MLDIYSILLVPNTCLVNQSKGHLWSWLNHNLVGSLLNDRLGSLLNDRLGSPLNNRLGSPLNNRLGSLLNDHLGSPLNDCLGSLLNDRSGLLLNDRLGPLLNDRLRSLLNDHLQLKGENKPKTCRSIIEFGSSHKLIDGFHFICAFIVELISKITVSFYLHLILLSISSCLESQYCLKLAKALSMQLHRFCIAKHDYKVFIQKILDQVPPSNVHVFASMMYPIQLSIFSQCLYLIVNIAQFCAFHIQTITCWYKYTTC